MSNVAIIPARGGSKRIPRKNVRPFAGKPIIAWSIEAALESRVFDDVIVSTDDHEIAEVARHYGASVPMFRSAELSSDEAHLMPVLRFHARVLIEQGKAPDTIFCIYATAPFVAAQTLKQAVETLVGSDAEFVLAVAPFESPIQRAVLKGPDGCLRFAFPEYALTRSQLLEPRFRDAGQFFGGRLQPILQHDSSLFGRCLPIVLPGNQAVDIDTPEDWLQAETLWSLRTRP